MLDTKLISSNEDFSIFDDTFSLDDVTNDGMKIYRTIDKKDAAIVSFDKESEISHLNVVNNNGLGFHLDKCSGGFILKIDQGLTRVKRGRWSRFRNRVKNSVKKRVKKLGKSVKKRTKKLENSVKKRIPEKVRQKIKKYFQKDNGKTDWFKIVQTAYKIYDCAVQGCLTSPKLK